MSRRSYSLELTPDELVALVVALELARLRGIVPPHRRDAVRAIEQRAAAKIEAAVLER